MFNSDTLAHVQVKSQSEEVASAYTQLQKDKEGLQKERQKIAVAKAELQSQRR